MKSLVLLLCLVMLGLTGCAGHATLTRETQVKISNTIFLRPSKDKTIYLQMRNTSDNPKAILSDLPNKLMTKGYTVVDDPEKAHFIVQANTVFAAKAKPGSTLDSLIAEGFGAGIGGALGTAAVLSGGNSLGWIPGGAVIGAVGGFLASKVTEDTEYAIIGDVQIIEKTKDHVEQVITSQRTPGEGLPTPSTGILGLLGGGTASLSAPTAGQRTESVQEVHRGHERIHTTRLASMAQQMWMSTDEATTDLVQRLTDGVAGLF
jgi:hypothetical protein